MGDGRVFLACLAALGAAAFFAITSALQHRAGDHVATAEGASAEIGDATLLVRLFQQPIFLVGIVAELAGLALQTVALGLGSLVLVQPLLVTGLLLAIPLSARLNHRGIGRDEVIGALLAVAGVATFLVAAGAPRGRSRIPLHTAFVLVPVALVVAIGLVMLARLRLTTARAVLLAAAAGVLYGVSSGFIKVVADTFSKHGFRVLGDWPLYTLLVVGLLGTVFVQNAFQAGAIAAPLAVLTIVEPVSAVLVGETSLAEHLSRAPVAVLFQLVGAVIAALGVVRVTRSQARAAVVVAPHVGATAGTTAV